MENFNSDLPRHLDLLETQNTEESAQEPSQETEGASAQ